MSEELKNIEERFRNESSNMHFEYKDAYWDEALLLIQAQEKALFWKKFFVWFGATLLVTFLSLLGYVYGGELLNVSKFSIRESQTKEVNVGTSFKELKEKNGMNNVEIKKEAFFDSVLNQHLFFSELESNIESKFKIQGLKTDNIQQKPAQKDTVIITKEKIVYRTIYKEKQSSEGANEEVEKGFLKHFYDSVIAQKSKVYVELDRISIKTIPALTFEGELEPPVNKLDSVVSAKKIHFYLNGGGILSKGFPKIEENAIYEFDPTLGMDIHYSLSPKIELGLGLHWFSKTINAPLKLNNKTYDFGSQDTLSDIVMNKIYQLEIPLAVHFKVYRNLWASGTVSVTNLIGARGIESKYISSTQYTDSIDLNTEITTPNSADVFYNSPFIKSDLMLQGGLEYRHERASIMIKYFYGFKDWGKDDYFSNPALMNRNQGIRFLLRYRFLDVN